MSEPIRLESTDEAHVQPHEVFEIVVREQEPRLRAFVSALVRDPAAVDDLVQEAFLVAWRNLDRYDRTLPFGPWLRGIARKLCLAHSRRIRDSRLAFLGDEILEHLNRLYHLLDHAPGDTIEQQLASLRACLGHLPTHQRRVLLLHYEKELGCREIAATLGRTRESVKKLLQRARAWLGRCIEQRLEALRIHP